MLLAAVLAIALLAGCAPSGPAASGTPSAGTGQPAGAEPGKLSVVTTVFPQYDFTREIAGDHITLTMLLPPGAESHSYEPTPQDIITIQNCDVFIYVGGESDAWIEDILASMDTADKTVLTLMDMVEVKEELVVEGMEEEHGDASPDEAEPAEYDEHVWTSPKNAMLIVQALADTLCTLDAANADAYRQNADAYLARLTELDAAFEAVVSTAARNTLIFGDRFPFRYFADAYGLSYYAAFPGCSTQSEPSAATVAFLIDKVKAEGIPVVFHIELSSEKMADTICEDTGAQKRLFHSCHNVSKAELDAGTSYLSLMLQNVEALKEALA
ncbi:MAG: zinc ABC transporter substrate-binding protein [Ruminococcaceae bacterium]|nr:zinc ABC transporter substrate-binding protein [Oscillospiraceae bacterium]